MNNLVLSTLKKTWLIDIDGTIIKHNSHKQGGDILLSGVKEFFNRVANDFIILITAREKKYEVETKNFLEKNDIKYDIIIFDAPHGERILINDKKISGLKTCHSINLERDSGLKNLNINISEDL